MIVPLFAAALIAATSSPAPSASVPCGGTCLAGISVGEDKYRALARLQSQPIPGSDDRIMGDFNSYPNGLMLTVYYQKAVVAVSIAFDRKHGTSAIFDPYGVRLEDTSDHLVALRGKPDAVDGDVWRYSRADGIHWDYTVENGVIATILLSSVPTLP